MAPSKGQTVILYLRYGFQIEGVVKEWSDDQIVLTANSDHILVYNPREDLIMAKIQGRSRLTGIVPAQSEVIENVEEVIDKPIAEDYNMDMIEPPSVNSIQDEITETIAAPSNNLRIKKLGQLRTMLAKAEKEVVAGKLTSHQIQPETKQVQYVSPLALFKRQESEYKK